MKEENKDKKSLDTAQDELKALQLKCEEYLNGWKRERADFLNYKKEEMERIGQLVKYANEELILKILPILDSFCLAEKHVPDNGESAGFLQIKKQLEDFLAKEGIEKIETLGQSFDPNTMESVGVVEEAVGCPTSHQSGKVVEEIQRGYTLHGKLIRPAKVRVTK